MGDASDNIPGIAGVGEKTAKNLIGEYGTIENLYNHTDELKGKLKEKVEQGKDMAFLSKQLATIDINANLEFSLEELKFDFPLKNSARKMLLNLEFSSILKKDIFMYEAEDFSNEIKIEKSEKKQIKSEIIDKIMLDKNYFDGKILSIVFDDDVYFFNGETEYKILIKNDFFSPGLSFDEALKFLQPALCDDGKKLILFDRKKIRGMLASCGIEHLAKSDDVMLQKYVVDYTQKELSLNEVIERAGFEVKTPAYSQYLLYEKYNELLASENSMSVYKDIELPLCDVLYEMQRAGFKIDVQALNWSFNVAETADASILATIAGPFAYILVPIVGVLSWQLAAAAVTGFIAKENVVGTLAVCVVGLENLIDTEELAMLEGTGAEVAGILAITKIAALAYLMFNLFTPPCFAAIGAMNAEMKSAKWLWGGIGLQFAVGYTISYLVYTIGTLVTAPAELNVLAAVLGGVAVALIAAYIVFLTLNTNKKLKSEHLAKA